MSKIDEIFQSYVNKDYDELYSSAANSFSVMHRVYTEVLGSSQKSIETLMTLVFTAVCSDGILSNLEAKFLNDLAGTNYTVDQFINMANAYHTNAAYAHADEIFDSMPENVQAELLNLCLCVCAVDERISKEEVSYIMRLVD